MKEKHYDGYRSYQYLEAGADYKVFDLPPEVDRVPEFDLGLSEDESGRAQELLDNNLAISLHDHPTVRPVDFDDLFDYYRTGRQVTGYQGLSVSGLDAYFDNFMNGTAIITSKKGWKFRDIVYDIGMRFSDIAQQDFVIRAEGFGDIIKAHANGQVAMIPTLEAATPIENEIDRIDILYGLGIRSMGIAYSEANALGAGLKEKRDGGLTYLGEQAVARMNKLGILIDVAHCGDVTALDTIKASKDPIVISHAGARAVWDIPRLKPDEVIVACAERGGLIGIEAAPHTTISHDHPLHSLESVMDHFEYCVDLVGIDHVTFGPDTNFADHVGLHHAFSEHLSTGVSKRGPAYEEVDYVAGMENPGECFPNAVRWLVKHGYSDDEIIKVIGGNTMRVLQQVWRH